MHTKPFVCGRAEWPYAVGLHGPVVPACLPTTLLPMRSRRLLLPLGGLILAACSAAPAAPPAWTYPAATPDPGAVAHAKVIEVFKSPTCSCCHEWEAYLRDLGYTVKSVPTNDMAAVKAEHGLPQETWSCHTAVIAGYAVEGHVPVEAFEDLLRERPAIDAIALPGMPAGSPGMPGVKEGPFEVLAVDDGTTRDFGSY